MPETVRKFLFLFTLLFWASCTLIKQDSPQKLRIGFSQCNTNDAWRKTMNEEMQRELGFYSGYKIELIIKDAKSNNNQQIQDIQGLAKAGIDLLIVSPNEAKPLTPIVEQVYDQGIPVIVVDRKISSEKFTAYIGGENVEIGKQAAKYAAQLLKGKGKILEVTGLQGSTPTIERSKGFSEGLKQYPGLEIVKTINGGWFLAQSQQATEELFYDWKDFDLIFAHNDRMALGAYLSSQKHHLNPFIIGVDGLTGPNLGTESVLKGYIDGTFFYPTGGDKAIELAMNILEGKPYKKINHLKTIKIDHLNARTLQLQAGQIKQQQDDIDKQRQQMSELAFLLNKKDTFILLSRLITGLVIIIALMTVYFLYQKNKANRILGIKNKTIHQQNQRITDQRDKLLRVLKIAEEAAETKIRFFTNISHEFRQALSLVIHPINDLLSAKKNTDFKEKLEMVRNNAQILSRLSEEVLNFEKIEKNKYYLNFKEADLGKLLHEIVKSFSDEIHRKDLQLSTNIPETLKAYFDASAIEKVMSNLLSNSIKYNVAGGKISIKVKKIRSNITVAVSDTGIGIPENDIPYIFDRFFRSNQLMSYDEDPSSGLGLAICESLIQLHHGKIKLVSEFGEGSTFFFTIPQNFLKTQSKIKWEVENKQKYLDLKTPLKKTTILVVEDNFEMLSIISQILERFYTVIKAKNGEEGLSIALEHHPDLILSDIYMPTMDGIELCQQLKNNSATFHIPILLLTALNSEESKIKGFDTGADGYITKPFNEVALISRIQNLLRSRKELKEAFGNFPAFNGIKSKEKKEEDFIQKCINIIHEKGADDRFNLDQLAAHVNLSRSSLYRKIKDITGLKAVDFIKKGKLHYAARLLLTTDLTIGEVAYQAGFNDKKYFSRCFAKEYGDVPSKFKEMSNPGKSIAG